MQVITIAGKTISSNDKPFIIAELSGNHQRDFSIAKEMIKQAAEAGVDAIKLQSYTADSMTLDTDKEGFVIRDSSNLWQGKNLHSLYAEAATPYEWHEALFSYAKSLGLIAFSSPFDKEAVDMLEGLNVPCYKVASFENNDLPLIEYIAKTGKPIILSTGMASLAEIDEAVRTIRAQGNQQIILLKCTSTYPASAQNTNLATIAHMQQSFDCLVGLSDHTLGIGVSVASMVMGASVIEKHFVLDRNAGGVDAAFSLEPAELTSLVIECNNAKLALGEVRYGGTEAEEKSKMYRRSIYVSCNIKAGELFTPNNLKIVRPGLGMPPKYWETVLGRKASRDLDKGTPLSWELFS
ncbi:pseudaminic acid synthase [Agarivorans sp. TSD2052]|uniref:pseudaminic acid synthase n=1 Tax=Agarivorans sp. TSD2052 TaxID=2937286 RepID=UPI00200FF5BB|nr:pseudaminic acid synthase [Agarivorans sp. TSD2052]UPW20163.1 pseudaminic acid synthase [Agarivorans sp. TSD2052]